VRLAAAGLALAAAGAAAMAALWSTPGADPLILAAGLAFAAGTSLTIAAIYLSAKHEEEQRRKLTGWSPNWNI
jgi:mannitol-specific phosphotransferase system IIBC component